MVVQPIYNFPTRDTQKVQKLRNSDRTGSPSTTTLDYYIGDDGGDDDGVQNRPRRQNVACLSRANNATPLATSSAYSLAYSFPMHARIDNMALAAIKTTPFNI